MLKIALAGNPNCGKTTLFNMLTDSKQYTGNRPGVTVDKKILPLKNDNSILVADLPGVYSLSPFSPEEICTRDFLIDENPDVIINLVDASNLGRSLYLTTQLREIGIPMVIAVNMTDKLERSGGKIDIDMLSQLFSVPVISICAKGKNNTNKLISFTAEAAQSEPAKLKIYPNSISSVLNRAEQFFSNKKSRSFLAVRSLEGDEKYCSSVSVRERIELKQLSHELEEITGLSVQDFFAANRYKFIDKVLSMCLSAEPHVKSITQKIDKIVLNRIFAFPIFFAVLFLIYYVCITLSGSAVSTAIEKLSLDTLIVNHVQNFLNNIGCSAWLQKLIFDGVFSGVGSVLSFLPQIFMLFFSLAFLEESGYMARISFLTDKIFLFAGLSGKTVIPLLIGSGCSVPAVMSTRTIENDRQRRTSIILAPFIPCSAKLTVIVFVSSMITEKAEYTLAIAYIFAACAVFLSAILLKQGRIGSKDSTFIMELPSYILPKFTDILALAARQSFSFIKKAGSVILLSSIVIWFLSYFSFADGKLQPTSDFSATMLGHLGSVISPIFAPLGFGKEMSVAVISGFFAKENIVSTLEVLLGKSGISLSISAAISFLTFNLFCPPCIAAINAIRHEMNSIKHTVFALAYQTAFAYAMAFLIYHLV